LINWKAVLPIEHGHMSSVVTKALRRSVQWNEILEACATLTELPWEHPTAWDTYDSRLDQASFSLTLPRSFDDLITHGSHTPSSVLVAVLHLLLRYYGNKEDVITAGINADGIIDISCSQCDDMVLSDVIHRMHDNEVPGLQPGTPITVESLRSQLMSHDVLERTNTLPVIVMHEAGPVDPRLTEMLKPVLIFHFYPVDVVALNDKVIVDIEFSR